MLRGKRTLFINQYGEHFWATTVAELREQFGNGGSRVSKMYVDKIAGPLSGKACHIGYVIAGNWLSAYAPVELVQS